MRKYVPFTVTLAILAIFSTVMSYKYVYSQDTSNTDQPAEIKDFDGLKAEFKQETQDPESKNARFDMILHSNINSDRVKVEWTVSGSSQLVNDADKRTDLDIRQGQTYTIPVTIRPLGEGVTEVYGTAQSVNVDSSFLVTVRKNFVTDKDAQILPLTTEYQSAKNLSVVKNIVLTLLIVAAVLGLIYLGFRRLTKYLKAEPEVTFENEVDTNQPLASK